jgi:hypothetical protein
MANYADGAWGAAQYRLGEIMAMPEFKHKPSATLMQLAKGSQLLIPASERERVWRIKESDQQNVDINIIVKQATTAATARAYNHTGNINDDNKAPLTFVTRAQKFKYSLKGADRNIWQLGEQVAKQIRSAVIDLHGVLETYFLGLMNTNKTQVVVSDTPKSGKWDPVNHVFQILNADGTRKFQRVKGFMREQYYNGQLDAVVDEYFMQEAEYLRMQGAGNNQNLSWQIAGINMDVSEELATDNGYLGMGYVWPSGTVGFVDWIPRLNRIGFGDVFQNGGKYSTLLDPLGSGLTFAVHQYAAGADNNEAAGETQDVDVQVEISVDVAFVKAPVSTANLSPIVKFGFQEV